MRFLALDDEQDVLLLVQANVRAWGHECSTASGAAEAERILGAERPDVLLLDVAMPEMDGRSFLLRIRDLGLEPDHVYLVSALPAEHVVALADELGVGYIVKPFTAAELLETFTPLLEGAG
jgi:DNA-binding response OmpR family regulator